MRMKDILFEVERLHEAGLSIEQISARLNIPVPVINDLFKWMLNYENKHKDN
jgi:predicted transposase YdaD